MITATLFMICVGLAGTDTYVEELPMRMRTVRTFVRGNWQDTEMIASVGGPGYYLEARVLFPEGKFPINPKYWANSHLMQPSVGKFAGEEEPLFWVLTSDFIGVYERIDILCYDFVNIGTNHIYPIETESSINPSFTNRGGFMAHGDGLVVWDPLYDGLECNQCPQPYEITFWEVIDDRLVLTESVVTKRRYQPEGDWTDISWPYPVLQENDPLQEVGLRWSWALDVPPNPKPASAPALSGSAYNRCSTTPRL